MREKLIKYFNLRYITTTKWNDIYYSETHVFIFNKTTNTWKIKPR